MALAINKPPGTFSAWRKRKNRIPISVLKNMCLILGLKFELISRGIENINRDIVEVI